MLLPFLYLAFGSYRQYGEKKTSCSFEHDVSEKEDIKL